MTGLNNHWVTENTFPNWYTWAWARHGIFPPPLNGDPSSPDSVAFHWGVREKYLEPVDVTLSDEESIARMEAACRSVIDNIGDRVSLIPGTNSLIVGPDAA